MDMHAATLSEACLAKLRIVLKLTTLEFQPLHKTKCKTLNPRLLRGYKTGEREQQSRPRPRRACMKGVQCALRQDYELLRS